MTPDVLQTGPTRLKEGLLSYRSVLTPSERVAEHTTAGVSKNRFEIKLYLRVHEKKYSEMSKG